MRLRIVRVHSMHVASRATNREVYLSPLTVAQGVTQKVRYTLGRAWAFRLIAAEGFRSIEHVRKVSTVFFWVLTSFQLEVNLHMVAELLREL